MTGLPRNGRHSQRNARYSSFLNILPTCNSPTPISPRIEPARNQGSTSSNPVYGSSHSPVAASHVGWFSSHTGGGVVVVEDGGTVLVVLVSEGVVVDVVVGVGCVVVVGVVVVVASVVVVVDGGTSVVVVVSSGTSTGTRKKLA